MGDVAGDCGAGPTAVGVDGCRHGWLAVWRAPDAVRAAHAVFATPGELLATFAAAGAIAVDIPIGLSERGPRAADRLARERLVGTRAASIFPTPVRAVLDSASRTEASDVHFRIDGRRLSAQSWAILPKIRQWDAALRARPNLDERVYEIHPEVSFSAMNGGVGVRASKKTPAGLRLRHELLKRELGDLVPDELVPPKGVGLDDVIDAYAAFWSAQRILAGAATSLPAPPARDSVGLRSAIWF
jgi:predicted RNase H-like nuclease